MGPAAMWKQLKENLPFLAEKLPEMPGLLHSYLQQQPKQQQQMLQQLMLMQQKQLEQGQSMKLYILCRQFDFKCSSVVHCRLGYQCCNFSGFGRGLIN